MSLALPRNDHPSVQRQQSLGYVWEKGRRLDSTDRYGSSCIMMGSL